MGHFPRSGVADTLAPLNPLSEIYMRFSKLLCLGGLALLSASVSAQTLQDERPSNEDSGPAGIGCVYPLGSTDNEHTCDFMVYVQESKQNAYGSLVLLQKVDVGNVDGVMRRVDTLDLSHVVPQGHDVLISQCGRQGAIDTSVIAMVKTSDNYEVPAVKAWTVDFQNRELVEILNPRGIFCEQGSGD